LAVECQESLSAGSECLMDVEFRLVVSKKPFNLPFEIY
jgi:hypothetical protein